MIFFFQTQVATDHGWCSDVFWLAVLTRKNMKVNGKAYPIYYGTYKRFETTNQVWNNIMYSIRLSIRRSTKQGDSSNFFSDQVDMGMQPCPATRDQTIGKITGFQWDSPRVMDDDIMISVLPSVCWDLSHRSNHINESSTNWLGKLAA